MPRRYFNLPALIILLVTLLAAVWLIMATRPESAGVESAQAINTTLKVSETGTQITTDVSGSDLQQGAPPNRSATSPDMNPQQALPNYCTGSEVPYQDGCVPSQ